MRVVKVKPLMLMPPLPGHCRICAVKHEPNDPHDATSLFYGTRFKLRYGREATWADAVAHLPEQAREITKQVVVELGALWTEPPAGVAPIAERIDG